MSIPLRLPLEVIGLLKVQSNVQKLRSPVVASSFTFSNCLSEAGIFFNERVTFLFNNTRHDQHLQHHRIIEIYELPIPRNTVGDLPA